MPNLQIREQMGSPKWHKKRKRTSNNRGAWIVDCGVWPFFFESATLFRWSNSPYWTVLYLFLLNSCPREILKTQDFMTSIPAYMLIVSGRVSECFTPWTSVRMMCMGCLPWLSNMEFSFSPIPITNFCFSSGFGDKNFTTLPMIVFESGVSYGGW